MMFRRKLAIGAALIATLALTASCSNGGDTQTISGKLTVEDSDYEDILEYGNDCSTLDGYDDIEEGTEVVLSNEKGTIIGTGALGAGSVTGVYSCTFSYKIDDVPSAKIYRVEISDRGKVNYTRSELEGKKWKMSTTLG